MDWSNERYVRLYTRDSADLIAIQWEGRLVLYELLRKVDRAGVLDHGGDIDLVPDMLRIPLEVFRVGMERLKLRGVVRLSDRALILPNFLEAQDAVSTDAQRKRESRARRRDLTLASVTKPTDPVTIPDVEVTKRPVSVTLGHARSRSVTPDDPDDPDETDKPGGAGGDSLAARPPAAPAMLVPVSPSGPAPAKTKRAGFRPTADELAKTDRVLAYLRAVTRRRYQARIPATGEPTKHAERIVSLLRKGYTERDLRLVVWEFGNRWKDDPKMDQYLQPSTLFGPEKFDERLVAAKHNDALARGRDEPDEEPTSQPVLKWPGAGGPR